MAGKGTKPRKAPANARLRDAILTTLRRACSDQSVAVVAKELEISPKTLYRFFNPPDDTKPPPSISGELLFRMVAKHYRIEYDNRVLALVPAASHADTKPTAGIQLAFEFTGSVTVDVPKRSAEVAILTVATQRAS